MGVATWGARRRPMSVPPASSLSGGDTLRTFPHPRMRAPVEDAHRAEQLVDQNPHAEARDLLAVVQVVPFAIPATPGPAC